MLFWARAIEGFVFVLTAGAGLFMLYLVVDLFRLRSPGRRYKGGIGQWSWAAHRITGIGVAAFLFGHIIDTFTAGFGPELYDTTIELYKQWWFMPFEIMLIGAVLYHALNGLRIILFDFWPNLALKQKTFAYAEFVLFVVAFTPVVIFMGRHLIEKSPLG